MITVYLAGPLFSEAERNWHMDTKRMLLEAAAKKDIAMTIIWPYELITQEEIESLANEARDEIFRRCKEGLDKARIVVALLDGVQVDDGTAWEIGYFYGVRKTNHKIIGIRTDFRNAGESAGAIVNAMIEISCDKIVHSRAELLAEICELL
ncbi:Nucleoside 2-deoxyribosyltransferase [Gammaproteobacteria bacterium]